MVNAFHCGSYLSKVVFFFCVVVSSKIFSRQTVSFFTLSSVLRDHGTTSHKCFHHGTTYFENPKREGKMEDDEPTIAVSENNNPQTTISFIRLIIHFEYAGCSTSWVAGYKWDEQ
jgi:hypothetical protein